ncbi:hypothetical protein QCD71_22835 [Sphingomonas sp. PsM26]|nr:hypothetical protein [Sphingomonas sp. PsM26]
MSAKSAASFPIAVCANNSGALSRSRPLGQTLGAVALAGDALWIYARVVATARINGATMDWSPAAPPPRRQGGAF